MKTFKNTISIGFGTREGRITSSPQGPRAGWKQAFEQMARQGDDSLLDPAAAAWEDDDWQWT